MPELWLRNSRAYSDGAFAYRRATDHDGSVLDNVPGHISNPEAANGGGILSHIFGGRRAEVENNLAQASGLDPSAAGGILETMAPLVGSRGKKRAALFQGRPFFITSIEPGGMDSNPDSQLQSRLCV